MIDIFLEWAGDLSVGSTGDLALASGPDTTNQRVYRRLLTNPGDYLWQLDYGGGLAQFVGTPVEPADIEFGSQDPVGSGIRCGRLARPAS